MEEHNQTVIALIREAGGTTHASEAFRRQLRNLTRYWQARHRAEAHAPGRDRKLTEEDQQVIETVLLDLRTYEGGDLSRPVYSEGTEIVLINETAPGPGPLDDGQLNSEMDDEQANDISLDIRKHLLQRNVRPFSLAGFQTASPHIRLCSQDAARIHFREFREQCPHARLWTRIYLPGYSRSRDRAVLRFWFGPSSHGAAGTYFLTKQDGVWRVKWRDFAFYM
jgi:hypothetical protein